MDRFFGFPRIYSGKEEMCAKEISIWTGSNNIRLVIQGEGRFCFEDVNNPENDQVSIFIGFIDPLADIDIDTDCNHVVFCVDDDHILDKLIIIATDGSNGTGLELFRRIYEYYETDWR